MNRILRAMGRRLRMKLEVMLYARPRQRFAKDWHFSEAASRIPNRNEFYSYMHHHYHHLCSTEIRNHRMYFEQDQRGFGEPAFHAMWLLLLREFKPRRCLEIGVYRGQVISLWTLLSQLLGFSCEVHGISPFAPVGDAVSTYRQDVDYLADTVGSFDVLNLPRPTLVRALSTEPVAVEHILAREWDLIYIDGSHDYEVVLADYRLSCEKLTPGGILVLDDASLGTSFSPPLFSSAGHLGPSRVAAEFAMKELSFLGAVGHNNVFMKPKELAKVGGCEKVRMHT